MLYTSCHTTCLTTEDLGSQEIRKGHETLKLELEPSAQSPPPKQKPRRIGLDRNAPPHVDKIVEKKIKLMNA